MGFQIMARIFACGSVILMMSPSDASSQCVPETMFDMAASTGSLSVLNRMEWKTPYIDEKTMLMRHSVYVCILFFVESGFYAAASFS